VIDLEVAGDVVTTTANHPFWDATDQRFEPAAELDRGDQVQSADGRRSTIGGLKTATTHRATAYNLSVEGIHTYHVGADELLVHNSCGVPIPKGRWTISGSGTSTARSTRTRASSTRPTSRRSIE